MSEMNDTPEPKGVLGDGGEHAGKYNMALVRRAIKNRWPIPDEYKKLVADQMALIVGRADDPRNKIAAAKVLVAADAVNARREDSESREPTTVNVNVGIVSNLRESMKDREVRKLASDLTARLASADGDVEPGISGDGGHEQQVEAGEAPGVSERGPHRNGNGRH